MKIAAIAWTTFREAVRSKVLYTLVVFAIAMIAGSLVISQLTVGDPRKIIEDLGLGAISFFSILIAVLVGIGVVSQEIQSRTIYTILAKPVSRGAFLAGKFLGLLLTVAVNLGLMGAVFLALTAFHGGLRPALLVALLLVLLEAVVVIALALLFSSFSTPITSAVFTLSLTLVGHTSWGLLLLADRLRAPWQKGLCRFLYYVLPELDKFDVKAEVVHRVPVSAVAVGAAAGYALCYSGVLLLVASALFARRDFK